MRKAKREGQCRSCGRSNWVDAVDNFGQPYRGCGNCIVIVPDPLNTPLLTKAARR